LSSSPEVAGVDFFRHGGLPVPQVTIADAERVASSFGLTVRAQPLGSQQDSNFLLAEPAGAVLGVLKIANPAFSAAEIEARLTASAVLAEASPATVATGIDLWLADGNRLHLSLPAPGAPEVPPLVRPEYAAGWLSLVADPGPLLGAGVAGRFAAC
jgi:hypothetical protein